MNKDVKNVELDERVKALVEGLGLTGDETAFGAPILKNREFTIDGIQYIKSDTERDDFKSVLFRSSLGFVVPVNHIQSIEELPIPIVGNKVKDVARAACLLKDAGIRFVVTKYTKAEGKFGQPGYTPSSWKVELA
jgi:hypothetical protein